MYICTRKAKEYQVVDKVLTTPAFSGKGKEIKRKKKKTKTCMAGA